MNAHIVSFRTISTYILFSALIYSLQLFAVTRYVDLSNPFPKSPYTNWVTASRVIQDAIDVCREGDEVIVTNGVYEMGGAPTPGFNLSNRVCITIPITVRSVNGPEVTVILGEGPTGSFATRCVYIEDGGYLSGFMLRNGGTYTSSISYYELCGGGVFFSHGGIVSNCIIIGGSAQNYGGGAYCYYGGSLYDCTISRNVANIGAGGVHTRYASALVKDCTISENYSFASGGGVVIYEGDRVIACTIADNYSPGGGGGAQCFTGSQILDSIISGNSNGYSGAGIYCYSGSIISNCTISENTAAYDAGGIYCYRGGEILSCTIVSNRAYSAGGGISCNRGGIISNCTVKSNFAVTVGGGINFYEADIITCCKIMDNYADRYGGGVYINNSGEVNNCLVTGNRAGTFGGGVYCRDGGTINSCTISGNSAGSQGGGVELYNAGYITNSIVYYNTAPTSSNYFHVGTNMGYAYCCITPDPGGEGNITTSPQFVSIPATNYHLQITSPCINAGTNLPWMAGAVDLDGHARITEGRVDIGAYEWFCGTQIPFVDITTTPQTVSTALEEIRIAGTTDCHAVGMMLASNAANSVTVSFPAAQSWQTPPILLFRGDNVITVSATNFYGDRSGDQVVINRAVLTNYVSLDGLHIYPFTNWNMSATNIQSAVDAIPIGGVTIVSNGVYDMGSTVTPGHSLACRVVVDKAITLQSLNGPDVTIIAGQGPPGNNAVRCVYLTNLVLLSGFTLSNGYTRVAGDLTYDCSGGGILLDNGGIVSNCVAVANYALDRGGGMFCYNGGTVVDSDLRGNWGGNGAGICIETDGLITHSIVHENSANGDGGGVYCITNGTVVNCLLYENEARRNGGGAAWNVSCMIESSTIADNSAQNGGGVHGDGWGSIFNTIIMFNTAPAGPNINGLASCTYSCSLPKPSGPGNISDDPAFINIGADNFQLQFGSACLNAGANQPWMIGAKDLAGNPRICCGKVDMGAYEMLYGSGVPAVGITSTTIFIAYHLPTGPIAGTNNLNIVGTVWWSNVNNNTTGPVTPDPIDPTAWTADVPLLHNNNLVVVNGSNYTGQVAQDTIVMHRETYSEGIPKINADTLIFPYGGSMLGVDYPTNIIWNPAGITDLVDGTNLTINCISIHRSNDLVEIIIPATNMPNISGWCPWQPSQELISGMTTYVVRFEVIDSSSLSNSWVFYDHAFNVVPEPLATGFLLLMLVMLRKLNRQS